MYSPESIDSMEIKTDDASRRPTRRQIIVLLVAFMYFYSYYMNTALTEKYIEYRVTKDILAKANVSGYIDLAGRSYCNFSDPQIFNMVELQIELAPWRKNLAIASAVPGMLSVLVVGPLTDRYGRRLGLLLPTAGVIVRAIGYSIVSSLDSPLQMLYIPHALEALLGFFPTALMAAFAYASDVTGNNKYRTMIFVVIDAIAKTCQFAFVGQTAAIRVWSYTYPNLLTIALGSATLAVIFFLLPPSRPGYVSQVRLLDNFKQLYRFYTSRANFNPLLCFHISLSLFMVASLTLYGQTTIEPVTAAVQPLCWKMGFSGNFEVIRAVGQSVTTICFVLVFSRFLSDSLVGVVAGLLQIGGYVLQGFSTTTAMVSGAAVLGLGSGVTLSMVRVIISKLTTVGSYGALFAGVASLEVLSSSISSITFIMIYDKYLQINEGAVYFFMSGFIGFVVIIYCVLHVLIVVRNRWGGYGSIQ